LRGMTLAAAKAKLQEIPLPLVLPPAAAGLDAIRLVVFDQSPLPLASGERFKTQVHVVLRALVPELVGNNVTRAEALVHAVGLRLAPIPNMPKGVVGLVM